MSQKNRRQHRHRDKEMIELIINLYREIRFPSFLPEIPHEWLEEVCDEQEENRRRNKKN